MAGKSIMVQNKDVLREVLKSEKDPEVKRKLSFLSLVGGVWKLKKRWLTLEYVFPQAITGSTAGTLKVRKG